jgi:hypothetical protein
MKTTITALLAATLTATAQVVTIQQPAYWQGISPIHYAGDRDAYQGTLQGIQVMPLPKRSLDTPAHIRYE